MDCFAITKLPQHYPASQVSELVNAQKYSHSLYAQCVCVFEGELVHGA